MTADASSAAATVRRPDLLPAIDLIGGQCVRLTEGKFDQATFYNPDPVAQARAFCDGGAEWLHVVDLDGAKAGGPQQTALIGRLASEGGLKVEAGGGIRSADHVAALLDAGVSRVVIGSWAVKDPAAVEALIAVHGPERLVLAPDVRLDDRGRMTIRTAGWQNDSGVELTAFLDRWARAGACWMLITDVARDGRQIGANVDLYRGLTARFPQLSLIASGGIGTAADIRACATAGVHAVIVGRALYEGAVTVPDALAALEPHDP